MATIVKAKKDENTDSVIRRFKKRILIDDVLNLVKRKEFYLKPALQRKEAKKELEKKLNRERRLQRRMG
ncbi:30S ribosomal protein S21 [Candidatus Cerribacteria bacterium 'Amazon FNV 2010 28 9']|uniref:Small ribosomal subunit protein bS21 n=1 Tax=Candidatus Cerribacteria bacterium 'Amazon FNV 2010 28 9' TaxID=2081795 RepID=A0A317JTK5_9BACT|nr:MAG: 30S ribosomal protein S21 [Candidatus Cerribacteria bacterium 'Amazon FNV 2010 28 9']